MTRAVIFDLDGTLVDSLDDIADALDLAMRDHRLPVPPRAIVPTWIGGGARQLVAQAVAPELVEGVLASFRIHYAAHPLVHTRLYDGLAPVLDAMVAADVVLAVLTNKPHDLAVTICGALLAPWPFRAIVGAKTGVPLKPDPAAALSLAKELGVPPAACTMVGDSEVDVEMAHAAGMRAVAVSWGYRPRDVLVLAKPALVIDEPAALRQLVR